MKKATALILMSILVLGLVPTFSGLASATYGTKIIDGSLSDWTSSDLVAVGKDTGLEGANLDSLYVSWDDEYLYIAIKTNNTGSWDVAYGIGIDVDPGTGNGYVSGGDSWGRSVEFSNGFAPDYEIYFWWGWNSGMGTDHFNTYTGSGWNYNSISGVGGSFAYTGNTSTGLQTVEIKIPWSALGGKPEKIAVMAWVTGSGGSAVDSLPVDPAIDYTDIKNEWDDTDTFTSMAVLYVVPKTIDGNLSDWSENELVAEDTAGTGVDVGNLSKFYISWDDQYLYLAIETNNTKNGGMAYGFGIDIDPGTGNGYTAGGDAWGRDIEFSNGYALDYEVYFWWDGGSASITAAQLNPYDGSWSWPSLTDMGGKYNYTGDSSAGLKTLEVAVPWSAIGGMPSKFAVAAWVTGGDGSAVDVLPQEGIVADNADEWSDTDVFTEMADFEMFIPVPELTAGIAGPSIVGLNRTTEYRITVKNLGSLPASDAEVRAYVNDTLISNWTLTLGAGEERELTFTWKPNETGRYTLKVTVDEDNLIEEANEDNNVVTMDVDVVWVGKIEVDGNPDDWSSANLSDNTYKVINGTFIWRDAENDQRTDNDNYLEETNHTSSHADLTEVAVAKDDHYVYFLFRFRNMSNMKLGANGATFIAVPIDYKDGGKAGVFAGSMDMRSVIQWDIQMAVNLRCSGCSGDKAVNAAGNSLDSMLYFIDPSNNIVPVNGAVVGVNLSANTVEVRIPVEVFNGATDFNFQVATGLSWGGGVWNFGEPFSDDDISDAVDVLSDKPTLEEVMDGYLDYYIHIETNGMVEKAKYVDYASVRRKIQMRKFWRGFVSLNKYYGIWHFEHDYQRYLKLDEYFRNSTLPEEMEKKVKEYENTVNDLLRLYNEGKENIDNGNAAMGASIKIFRAYTGLKKVVREMEKLKKIAEEGNLERLEYLKELSKNLTKTIDGDLDDWDVKPVAVDETGYGQDGANLRALYVDYDDQFLYIAITTDNKASWRVSYGIAIDYRAGGYTTGQDSWSRKVSFTRGVDAELYFFWNGEFFGDPGTSTITSAQLALWNGTGWEYEELKWVGFYAYTGNQKDGLQTLEIAIPWKALGVTPGEINVVAYVTGQGAGDSAVDSLPLQDAVRDNDSGQEWGDEDTFTEFAVVTIE